MVKRIYISQDKLSILKEGLDNTIVDVSLIDEIEYWLGEDRYYIEAFDVDGNEVYNDQDLKLSDIIYDLGEDVANIITNHQKRFQQKYNQTRRIGNVGCGNIQTIEYAAYERYDIILKDSQYNVLYQDDNIDLSWLEELVGSHLALRIQQHEGTFNQGSYRISDITSSIQVDINNVNEVNALAKKIFPSYSEGYSGRVHGWLLTDGTILDFGDNYDHAQINWIQDMTLSKFEDLGNIRIGYDSFELCCYPTLPQKKQLRKLIAVNDIIYVDIGQYSDSDTHPINLSSASFTHAPYKVIMGQIDQFFENHIKLKGFVGINENIQLEVEPNDVDLTSFKGQDSLNPQFWKDDLLDSRIRLKLLDIADDFFETLKLKWVKPIDIVLTGSICNFNWSEFSDIDIHIIIDFKEVDENTDLVREYVNTKKNEWNNEHEALMIHDLPVELYVEDLSDDTTSEGIYSLNTNEWLKQPKNAQEMHISERGSKIKNVAADLMTMIDDLEDEFESNEDSYELEDLSKRVDKMLKNISKIRKMGLNSDLKEKSLGNILYKILRRTEYLDKIWSLKVKIYDKLNSII